MFVHRMLLPVGCLLHVALHRCMLAAALLSLLFGRTRPPPPPWLSVFVV
jgi:hypothetical protein